MNIIYKTLFVVLLFTTGKAYAQDFVYTPKNPAFGGNPYNSSWLLSSAQAQNDKEDDSLYSYNSQTDPLSDFAESLNQQILSQLARKIISNQFGEDALTTGTYLLGNYQIEIGKTNNGLNIIIQDKGSGSKTTVTVPFL